VPEDYLAIYEEFDKESLTVTYSGDSSQCSNWLRYATCEKEFNYSFKENPQFFVPVEQGSKLQEKMLKFRK